MRGFLGEVKVFLRESWELFYWSLWCPSKLHIRINQIHATSVTDINFKANPNNSLPLKVNFRFLNQLLITAITLNLISHYFRSPFESDFLIELYELVIVVIASYFISLISIPISFAFPLIASTDRVGEILSNYLFSVISIISNTEIVYVENNSIILFLLIFSLLGAVVEPLVVVFAPLFILAITVIAYVFICVSTVIYYSIYIEHDLFAACILFFTYSAIGNKLIARFLILVLLGLTSFPFIYLMSEYSIFSVIALFLFYFRVIPEFLILSIWCTFLSAILRQKYYFNKVYAYLINLMQAVMSRAFSWFKRGLDELNDSQYDNPIYAKYVDGSTDPLINPSNFKIIKSLDLAISNLSGKEINVSALEFVRYLPPYNFEFLSLPIPNYSYLLIESFREDPDAALLILENINSFQKKSYQYMVDKSIPTILANQFLSVKDVRGLANFSYLDHPILSRIASNIYTDFNIETSAGQSRNKVNFIQSEGKTAVITGFQTIATDLSNALNASTIALRERGLDRIIQNLQNLQTNLPALGLKAPAIKRWTPVILHWQRLIELELQDQQKLSQGELLNPFQFGNPLRPNRDTIFQGRRALADRLYRLILDRDRPTLVLYGTRRAGKTSFLLNLSRFLPSDLIPVYLDMQSSAITNSEADFCYGLTRAIHKDTQSQGLKLPAPYPRDIFKSNPYGTLEDWLDNALPKIEANRRLLLNLDEFEKIGSAIANGNLSFRLLDQLRNLIQHRDELAFMFSGVQTLDELGPNWSSYFISVVPIEMGYLEPHEAEALLRNPDPDFKMRYSDGVIEEILRLTCCQPYLVQLMGSCLVNQANQSQTTIATLDLLEAAIPDAFTNGEPYFTNLWQEFTGTTPAEVAAGQQYLIAIATNTPLPTSPETIAARRRMIRFHLIQDNNTIEIPLFDRWITDRAIS
jgi:hypothetical protein